ncbi:prepilin-type N-terminal cleavage/methylation domain-containing protein [Pseudidiomarina woesei]|uniref:prepilin-type N-terminal cleavage/methylation domain-containing protein n=1 Tax=Pseudidiomarina woesei TaxID=1381080 RepID=UPI0006E3178E|nr:prepilin-type N-terminal cleavage/methylation domain-containing protein [Pseudidiomarina woesei]
MISKLAYTARTRGFTFIEVLVALVIIAVGVAGLVSLQRTFIQSSVRAAERTAALELAQHRLEELRFTVYQDIAAGSDTVVRDDKTYSLTWSVAPQYFNGQWRTTGDANLPDPLPPEPDAKSVNIEVAWQQRGGEDQTLTLEGWLGRLTMRDGGLAVTAPPPRNEPRVVYNPGAAPEVIAVKLTEDDAAVAYQVKETTRPTPTVQRTGDKLTVRFDTVTYDEATQTQRVEDFITVNCSCELTGFDEGGLTPQRLTLIDGRLALDPDGGRPTRKITGVPNPDAGDQSELCLQCCRDHHDNSTMVANGTVYKHDTQRNQDGNHRHFRMENGVLTQATGSGAIYDESCRMRRIDGWYAMYPDWQFYALTATSADYLINPAGAEIYTDYVRDVVKALVMGDPLPAAPDGRDMYVYPGGYQLIGRGIYLDDMSPEHESVVRQAIVNGELDWISKVPFYEVNLTLLADWQASNEPVAEVTNEAIQTIVNVDQDYYGTYSRGRVTATSTGASEMTVTAKMGNASVLGSQPVHVNEQGSLSSSLTVNVDGEIGDLPLYSITGNIYCLQFNGQACKNSHYKDVSVTGVGVECTFSKQGNADTGSFACNGIPAGTTTTINFYKDGFSFNPSSKSFVLLDRNETVEVIMQEN